MKKKHNITKLRVVIPAIALLLLFVSCSVFVLFAGRVNTVSTEMDKADYILGSANASLSDDGIVKINDVYEKELDGNRVIVNVLTESVGSGNVTVSLSMDVLSRGREGEDITGASRTIEIENDLFVAPFGVIYNKTGNTFTGIEVLFVLLIGTMLIFSVALILSIIEKQREGEFSYSMVVRSGLVIYFIISSEVIFMELLHNMKFGIRMNFHTVIETLFSSAKSFVALTVIPLMVMAVLLSISNIQLVRREGFRLTNLLGFFLGIVTLGGVALIYWLNTGLINYTDVGYHVTTLISIAFAFLYCYFECMLLSTVICAMLSTRYTPPLDLDYIIILGCAIRSDGTPTPLLKGRVECALDFERRQYGKTGKHATFVPSGGQGSDEVISEAESMKRCLMEYGVPEEQIIEENKSVNTYQNMAFSKNIISENEDKLKDVNIGFSTTNYHVFRSYTLANKLDMEVKGLSAKTKLYYYPNAFVREFIGLVWEQRSRHLLFMFLLVLGVTGLYIFTDVIR